MQVRFFIDPETGHPHINNHGISELEVIDVLNNPGEDRAGREGARVMLGRAASGRYLKVIYVSDEAPDSVFVVIAYVLSGKPLFAYRRRQRRKNR